MHTEFDSHLIAMHMVNKWFDTFHVLRDINLEVTSGEKIVICGPSGSGKSTLIRTINLLEEFRGTCYELYHVTL